MKLTRKLSTSPTDAIHGFKQQTKRLRDMLQEDGKAISHGEALEMVARQHGYRDWNTLSAAETKKPVAANSAPAMAVGSLIAGRYLNQPFVGEVLSLTALSDGEHFKITIHFAEPVDVVTFDSFSAFRHRVSATVNRDGISPQKTSNGVPHLVIER